MSHFYWTYRSRNVWSIEIEDDPPSGWLSASYVGWLNTTSGSDRHNEACVSINLPDFNHHNVKF